MKYFALDSIQNKLVLLTLFTVTPCLAILLYSGIEQRRWLIEMAESDVLSLTHTIAEAQNAYPVDSTDSLHSVPNPYNSSDGTQFNLGYSKERAAEES